MRAEASPWRGAAPLLLASTSATRRMLLEGAGLPVETEAPGIDERALEPAAREGAASTARRLAAEKALAVSRRRPDRTVIGADQTLACEGALFHKPPDRAAAKEQLAALSGRMHVLHSAFALAEGGAVIHEGASEARMTMRSLGAAAIERYLDLAGEAALQSVGAYQVEGMGIHLFDRVEGDHSTILGLPLIPLLATLREKKLLAF
jgi:septum formation protein